MTTHPGTRRATSQGQPAWLHAVGAWNFALQRWWTWRRAGRSSGVGQNAGCAIRRRQILAPSDRRIIHPARVPAPTDGLRSSPSAPAPTHSDMQLPVVRRHPVGRRSARAVPRGRLHATHAGGPPAVRPSTAATRPRSRGTDAREQNEHHSRAAAASSAKAARKEAQDVGHDDADGHTDSGTRCGARRPHRGEIVLRAASEITHAIVDPLARVRGKPQRSQDSIRSRLHGSSGALPRYFPCALYFVLPCRAVLCCDCPAAAW